MTFALHPREQYLRLAEESERAARLTRLTEERFFYENQARRFRRLAEARTQKEECDLDAQATWQECVANAEDCRIRAEREPNHVKRAGLLARAVYSRPI